MLNWYFVNSIQRYIYICIGWENGTFSQWGLREGYSDLLLSWVSIHSNRGTATGLNLILSHGMFNQGLSGTPTWLSFFENLALFSSKTSFLTSKWSNVWLLSRYLTLDILLYTISIVRFCFIRLMSDVADGARFGALWCTFYFFCLSNYWDRKKTRTNNRAPFATFDISLMSVNYFRL